MSSKRQKLLVISGVFPPMPIAEADHIARLCSELAQRGYDIDLLTSTQGKADIAAGYRVHAVMPGWDWANRSRIAQMAREIRPDIVLIWYVGMAYDYHPMITFAASQLKAILPRAQIVTQVTAPVGSDPLKFPKSTRALRKAVSIAAGTRDTDFFYGTLLRDSDHVIFMADSHLQQLTSAYPAVVAKSSVVPPPPLIPMSPATDASRRKGRELLGADDATPLFAYFGRLYRGKGLEYLLEAFRAVHADNPATRLAIIGGPTPPAWHGDTWSVEQLHDQARDLKIDHAVTWTGEFPFDSDIGSTYLRAADFAVLPFDWGSALNNSSLAACASHGLPVITTRRDIEDPELIDGKNVLLCPPKDAAALEAAMRRLLADPALTQRLHEGANDLTQRHFSWATSVDRTVSVLAGAPAKNVQTAA